MTTATNNAKQLFLLMVEFDQDYGEFPSDFSADTDEDLSAFKGSYSNAYLGQFIAGGYTQSEEIFYAKGGSSSRKKPDNVCDSRANILEAGECGFAYLKGLSTSSESETPLLLTPMSGKGTEFDPDPHHRAVVLFVDGSVQTLMIDPQTNHAMIAGRALFESGKDSPWQDAPFISENLLFPK